MCWSVAEELGELGVLVEAVEVREVLGEVFVVQQRQVVGVERAALEAVDREDVAEIDVRLEPEVDVEAHQEVAHRRRCRADAVVVGGDPLVVDQLERRDR